MGIDRCLRRHWVGNLRDLKAKAPHPRHSGFKLQEQAQPHIEESQLSEIKYENRHRVRFVFIYWTTRWARIRIFTAQTAAHARRILRGPERACPIRFRTILTENGKEITDRLFCLSRCAAEGKHEVGMLCADLKFEHRLTPPKLP